MLLALLTPTCRTCPRTTTTAGGPRRPLAAALRGRLTSAVSWSVGWNISWAFTLGWALAIGSTVGCASAPVEAPTPVPRLEATSLLGAPLTAPPLSEVTERRLELDLESARLALEDAPSEQRTIWVGRRLGYLGRYDEAIRWYLAALVQYPDSYRLRRHLGHRLITVRRLDDAIGVLTEARRLAAEATNRIEPDGAPGPEGEPRSTTHGNIDYHLALAYYARGDFNAAADLWVECARRWAGNDDSRVAAMHWAHVSLLRAGRQEEARSILELVGRYPDVIENVAYLELIQLYRGELKAGALLARKERNAALEYGLSRYLIRLGAGVDGEESLIQLTRRPEWPAFGVLAAEADLAAR